MHAGIGGSPNGRVGGTKRGSGNIAGGTGFSLSFTMSNGNYGQGVSAVGQNLKSYRTSGGSGGYNTNYVSVTSNSNISIVVGSGGYKSGTYGNPGASGFVLIAYGEGIE